MRSLILGSQSSRRKELLELAGFQFSIKVSQAEEVIEKGMTPEKAVISLARLKSKSIPIEPEDVLLTSDTVVALDGDILGKPGNATEAEFFLRRLSGRTHEVYTGVALRTHEEEETFSVCTKVTFFELSDREIEWYVSTGEAFDKAGGYGIQGKGALFIDQLEGDYYSVMGLPISRVARELRKMGIFLH